MVDESQMIFKEVLQLVYEKGQEEGASLNQLLKDASELLRLLVKQ